MKTILMTGAAGGVAGFLRNELRDKYALRLCDRENIDDLAENETFVAADLLDTDALGRALEDVEQQHRGLVAQQHRHLQLV